MPSSRWNSPKNTKLLVFLGATLPLLAGCQACRNLKGGGRTPRTQHEPEVEIRRTPPDAIIAKGGIPNVGSTCYLNAVMQIIARLYPDAFDGDNTPLEKAGKALVDQIKDDTEAATRAQAQAFYDKYLPAASIFSHQRNTQEDAVDALIVLLDLMGSAPKATLQRSFQYTAEQSKAFPLKKNPPTNSPKTDQLAFLTVPPGSTSKIMSQLVNDYLHGNNEEHSFLRREIKPEEEGEEIFKQLKAKYPAFNTKKLFKRDAAGNETPEIRAIEVKGNLKTTNSSLTDLDKLKNRILPIKLSRYAYSKAAGPTKLETQVQNPFNFTLNTTSAGGSTINYELEGFIFHHGSVLRSGHYTAYVKNKAGKWIHYDDHEVKELTAAAAAAAAQQAYLYFYKPTT